MGHMDITPPLFSQVKIPAFFLTFEAFPIFTNENAPIPEIRRRRGVPSWDYPFLMPYIYDRRHLNIFGAENQDGAPEPGDPREGPEARHGPAFPVRPRFAIGIGFVAAG